MKASTAFILLLLTSALFTFAAAPMGKAPKRAYYIALGDSMTAGFLAYTSAAKSSPAPEAKMSLLSSRVSEDDQEVPPPYMWGDWRYAEIVESKNYWSWATGSRPNSIATRFQDWLLANSNDPIILKPVNAAESGIRAEHLPRQSRLAVEKIKKSGAQSLDLVTMLFGANDACKMPQYSPEYAETVRGNIRKTMENLAEAQEFMTEKTPIRVFMSALPNIPILYRPEIENHKTLFNMSCKKFRDEIYNDCERLKWSTPEEYQDRVARVQLINEAIWSVANEYSKDPRFSVIYDNAFFSTNFDGSMLAADCFHPGRRGQKEMAKSFWSKMTWFH